jgi:hypothetical protein
MLTRYTALKSVKIFQVDVRHKVHVRAAKGSIVFQVNPDGVRVVTLHRQQHDVFAVEAGCPPATAWRNGASVVPDEGRGIPFSDVYRPQHLPAGLALRVSGLIFHSAMMAFDHKMMPKSKKCKS